MSNCDKLIDECIPGDAKKCKWKYAIVMYNAAMKILGKKSNYTVDEKKNPIVCQLLLSHLSFNVWKGHCNQLLAYAVIRTHYVVHDCWGNLYHYSNQGWEALNWLMKSFIY